MKVQRREVTDELTRDGQTVLLVDGRLVMLSELSAAIWNLTREVADVGSLAGQLESTFGAPSDRSSVEATMDAVADLVHHGVLRRSG